MKKLTLLLLMMICVRLNAQWIQCNGPYGGNMICLVQNGITGTIFAGTYSNGIYRFNSLTGEWESLLNKLPTNYITRLANVDSTLYAPTYLGLFKSTDDGNTWNNLIIDSGFSATGIIYCRDSILILTGAEHKILLSTNSGLTFTDVSLNLVDAAYYYYDITMIGNRLFLLSSESVGYFNTISYSDDLGQTWNKPLIDIHPPNFWGDTWFNRLRVFNNKIYALGASSIYVSQDNGITWYLMNTPGIPSNAGAQDIYISNDTILIGSSFNGLYISVDNGNNFVQCSTGFPLVKCPVTEILKSQSNELLASSRVGVYKSINTGITWNDFNNKIDAINVTSFSSVGNELFIGTQRHGVFSTSDEGNTWDRKSSGLDFFAQFQSIQDIILVGNRLVVGTQNEIFYSDDHGSSWVHISLGLPNLFFHFELGLNKLYAGTSDGIYYSLDSAATWHELVVGPYCDVPGLMIKDNLIIAEDECSMQVYSTNVRRSGDGGNTFSSVNTDLALMDIESIDSLIIAANSSGYMAKSVDYGINWSLDTAFGSSIIGDIYILNSKYIFLSTDSGKIYLSKDTAATWIDVTGNFIGYGSRFFRYKNNLFVGSSTGGLWKMDMSFFDFISDPVQTFKLSVYPNPTNEYFTFIIPDEFKNNNNLHLTVYNGLGRIIKEFILTPTENEFKASLRDEPAGLYFLKLNGDEVNYISKIVKIN